MGQEAKDIVLVGDTEVPAADIERLSIVEHDGQEVNASGHEDQLDRQFNLAAVCALGLVTGGSWPALGSSVVISIYNGGPPGVIYEQIAASFFYLMIGLSLAELASAIPSAGALYHWATVTGGRFGRVNGFFAGWFNLMAYLFGTASIAAICGQQTVAMYGLSHPDFVAQRWHVYISYLACLFLVTVLVVFGNRLLPLVNNLGLFFLLSGFVIVVIAMAALPETHASHSTVWLDWVNSTGWSSDGFVFCAGMLNAAFSLGAPDCAAHVAEEVPRPRHNVPRAIMASVILGSITGFIYLVSLLYAVTDLDAILTSTSIFPLGDLYRQATGTSAGAIALLFLTFVPSFCTLIGITITCSRSLWTLARDDASPFASHLGIVNERLMSPANATLTCSLFVMVLGAIYVASSYAFSALIGTYAILTTISYLQAILPFLMSGRRNLVLGPFNLGRLGFVINTIACGYIIAWNVIYMFPYEYPVDAQNMNYSAVIVAGIATILLVWWLGVARKTYAKPHVIVGGGSL